MIMIKKINIIIFLFLLTLNSICLATQPKEELKQIKKELEIHKKRLKETEKLERNIVEDLKKVSKELNELEEKIKSHRIKIKNLKIKISETEKGIENYSLQIEAQKNSLANRIRGIQRLHYQQEPILIVFFEKDITKTLRLIRNTQKIMNVDRKLIGQYKKELNNLIAMQIKLKKLYVSLTLEEQALKKAEQAQKQKKKEREILLVEVRKDKALYEKKIKELKENAKKLTKLLQEAEKEEKTDKSEGFTKRRGTLLWPVSGPIVAHYGSQKDPIFNMPLFRSGIYIQAPDGTAVKAAAEGKVVYANYFKGYENLVIINHGDSYYTVYGNLGSITVKKGSYVKTGQIIGTVGEKSDIDTTALYFEVRYRGKPLNPKHWLRK